MIAFPLAETNFSLSVIDIAFQCLLIYIGDNITYMIVSYSLTYLFGKSGGTCISGEFG